MKNRTKKERIIGVTGSFGTAKSYTVSIFRTLGCRVIDADKIGHGSLKKGTLTYKKIVKTFGRDVVKPDGSIDRRSLGKIIFNNDRKRSQLNSILHPVIVKKIRSEISCMKGTRPVVLDAALLFEAGCEKLVDKIVVVRSSRKTQIGRVIKKFGFSKDDALRRIKSQMPLNEKIRRADFVISNDGPRSSTKRQVREVWRKLWK